MTTLLYLHPSSLEHDTGPGHPESPARMRALMAMFEREERKGALIGVERRTPPRATRAQLERVHTGRYVDAVLGAIPQSGHVRLDPDTVVSPGSGEAALRAAGAAVAAVDAVRGGEADNAFCCVRPPGHHAERRRAMGFCFFNNVAVGAAHALAQGVGRLAIVDFDVHHGNGTEDIFEANDRVLMVSTFRYYSFKELDPRRRWSFRVALPVAAVLLLILLNPAWFFLTVSVAYAVSGPVLWLRSLVRRRPEGSARGEPPAAGGGSEEART